MAQLLLQVFPTPALLVVDDKEENRYTLSQQLNVQGYDN